MINLNNKLPFVISIGMYKIASGFSAATFSILTPP